MIIQKLNYLLSKGVKEIRFNSETGECQEVTDLGKLDKNNTLENLQIKMKTNRKKLYVITRNGEYFPEKGYTCIEGYSCATDSLRDFKRRKPNDVWKLEPYNPQIHIK